MPVTSVFVHSQGIRLLSIEFPGVLFTIKLVSVVWVFTYMHHGMHVCFQSSKLLGTWQTEYGDCNNSV